MYDRMRVTIQNNRQNDKLIGWFERSYETLRNKKGWRSPKVEYEA